MNSSNREISDYRVEGGCLTLLDPYVERAADTQLYEFAQSESRSLVCFVLAPRQMGKSSLMVRTADRLTTNGQICVQINLHQLGEIDAESTLYYSFLVEIINQLDDSLKTGLYDILSRYWQNDPNLAPPLKFKYFLTGEISPRLPNSRLILFVDEVQNLLAWELQSSFLAFIRSLAQVEINAPVSNIRFVLLGVAKPSDLLTGNTMAWNLGEFIELDGLTGDCEPLQAGLKKVSENPTQILERIVHWSGGQPFLTQVLCHLVATTSSSFDTADVNQHIDRLVKNKVIDNWQQNLRLSLHLPTIEDWFMNVEPSQKRQKRLALEIYINLLQQRSVSFERSSVPQWELLISGLVKKEGNQLTIRNPIYQQIFDRTWAESKLPQLQEDTNMPDINTIYNRQVFIVVDQSASMRKKDGGDRTRWERLQEEVEGDLSVILDKKDPSGQKICDSVRAATFNVKGKELEYRELDTVDQVADLFYENEPFGTANITSVLKGLIDLWFDGRELITKEDVEAGRAKAALYIIFVDGQVDDAKDFENLIRDTARRIDDHRIVKFVIIGLGDEVSNVRFFDEFDINKRPTGGRKLDGKNEYKPLFYLATGAEANIGVFELKENIRGGNDFIKLLERQIKGDPANRNNVRKGFTLPLDVFDA
ncbi:MAG: hypothetical protein HC916_14340 [Coleofasciculaceae cyanobacterium SM2_1_6]|nr:hypothetical protein [Coleofasciculaceae cyanobacterium SM2_1_6]